jgi:hypothetical protein
MLVDEPAHILVTLVVTERLAGEVFITTAAVLALAEHPYPSVTESVYTPALEATALAMVGFCIDEE